MRGGEHKKNEDNFQIHAFIVSSQVLEETQGSQMQNANFKVELLVLNSIISV